MIQTTHTTYRTAAYCFFLSFCLILICQFGMSQETDCSNIKDSSKEESPEDVGNIEKKEEKKEPPRRALPAPFASPPFPSGEYQGYPLIGVPYDDTVYPLMQSFYDTPCGELIKKSRIKAYGWLNASGNISNCRHSNSPFLIGLSPMFCSLINLSFV